MKSVSWILVMFLFAMGCAEPTVVDNAEDQSKNETTEAVDVATEQPEVAEEATAEHDNEEVEEPVAKELTPQEELAELRQNDASVDEYIAFMNKIGGTDLSLSALSVAARNRQLDDEDKAKLREFIVEKFIADKASDNDMAFSAVEIMFRLSGGSMDDDVLQTVFDRFIDGQGSLNANSAKLISMANAAGSSDSKAALFDKLLADFADDKMMVQVATMVPRGAPGAQIPEFLKALAEKSTNKDVQGNALNSLVSYYESIDGIKNRLKDPSFASRVPKDIATYVNEFNQDDHAEEISAIYDRIIDEFADVQTRRGTLGEMVEDKLFVRDHLSIGKEAPDIVGEDLDGEEFKLSDYRGKVVLLDFWGDW